MGAMAGGTSPRASLEADRDRAGTEQDAAGEYLAPRTVAALALGLAYAAVDRRPAVAELAASGAPTLLAQASAQLGDLAGHDPGPGAHARRLLEEAIDHLTRENGRPNGPVSAGPGRTTPRAMTGDNHAELFAALASANGHGITDPAVERLSSTCARLSGGWHAAIEVRRPEQASALRGMSSALAERAADLEFTTGQGPARDALATRVPILVDDLGADARWPQTAPGWLEAGVCSVAALPLQVGAATIGTLTLLRDRPVTFGRAEIADLLALAAALTDVLLEGLAGHDGSIAARVTEAAVPTAAVHQATGMVAVQLDCDLTDALVRLRARAYRQGLLLADIAAQVVAGTVRLRP